MPSNSNVILSSTPPKSIIQIKAHSSTSKIDRNSRKQSRINCIKTTGVDRSSQKTSQRRSRSVSAVSRSDQQFQTQHDVMMSRQQFRTRTTKGRTGGRGAPQMKSKKKHQGGVSAGSYFLKSRSRSNPRQNGGQTIQTTESYESGYSHMSRQSDIGSIDSGRVKEEAKSNGAKMVIQELNKAIGYERRIAAITNACAEFDHWDTERHNAELQLGGANVLGLVLSMTDEEDEIRMICAALEMVYRASTEIVRKSYQDFGPAVIPLLLKLLERCEDATLKHAEVSILNISKVLLYFSRVPELRAPLARHPGILDAFARVATAVLNPDSRVLRMRAIANLSNAEENKLYMMNRDGLLDSVLKIAALDLSESAREYASASLMDIASSPDTQVAMAKNEQLLGTLVKLAVTDERHETREYAVTTMQNLAFSKDNRLCLVSYSDGVFLEALKKVLSTDSNDKSRRRAAGALTNLACDETGDSMGSHSGLIDTLSRVTTHDKNYDVQKRACLALTKIASVCTSKSKPFEKIMSALITASTSPNSTGISAVFRVQARDMVRRAAMARLPGILETLAEMSTAKAYSSKDRDNAMRAIMHLTNENKNRKILCNKVILKALVEASNLGVTDSCETRDSAVVALERLATEVSNRQYMARHAGLLVAIARATERESKSELAGDNITQPRLAKQLLMSLLLAM